MYSNKREEKLVTPVLIDSEENDNRRKVLGIQIERDDKIQLKKRWGDPDGRPMIINGEQDKNTIMEITPFSNALATI
ncbi:MAG: hypothetical protein M3264_00725 [Thermoproteota archaeon]|nr:hypothetical protein [Thermoproteota archaeon]